jgi:hypothetical protein
MDGSKTDGHVPSDGAGSIRLARPIPRYARLPTKEGYRTPAVISPVGLAGPALVSRGLCTLALDLGFDSQSHFTRSSRRNRPGVMPVRPRDTGWSRCGFGRVPCAPAAAR